MKDLENVQGDPHVRYRKLHGRYRKIRVVRIGDTGRYGGDTSDPGEV
jgi:hypothetical protein